MKTERLPECCQAHLEEHGAACVFGCGARVDSDTGICPSCREHSANAFECEACGTTWEDWDGDEEWMGNRAWPVDTDDHAYRNASNY